MCVVHNGIIENYASLKKALIAEGYVFSSDTDTELLAALAQTVLAKLPALADDPAQLVREVLAAVTGTYGAVFLFAAHPDLLIAARRGSPLLIGCGDGEYWVGSDAAAFIAHTKTVEYIEDGELAVVTRGGYELSKLDALVSARHRVRPQTTVNLTLSLEAIEKGTHKHFMIKEIMEQPKALADAMRGRVDGASGTVTLGGLAGAPLERLAAARRLIIVGCGTSFHSGQVGEYLIEALARLPVDVEYASEFRYRRPILRPGEDVLLAISQSGETADTLAAVREAKARGVLTLGVVNVVGSTIARETDAGAFLHVGPEIGVASTKAFTGQVAMLTMLAIALGEARGELTREDAAAKARALLGVPALMEAVLARSEGVRTLAAGYRYASSFLFLGRGFNFPVALEGALKLKEISYIHAEGYAAAEMKHGPLALIDRHMPVVVIAPARDPSYDKIKSNLEEVLARGGSVIVVTDEGNDELDARVDAVIKLPAVDEFLSPLLTVLPLQLLAYYIADARKNNVDQPRNLAKSVTVE